MGAVRNEPTFVGIGAQKCGSSSVADYLRLLGASIPQKELHYFQRRKTSRDGYLSLFETEGMNAVFGEFTPDYLYSTTAISRLQSFLSETRFLVVLRDPVVRFYSAANHGRGLGRIPKTWSASRLLDSTLRGANFQHWSRTLIWKGLYGPHLLRTFRLMPAERIQVSFLEELTDVEVGSQARQRLVDFAGLSRSEGDIPFPRTNTATKHLGLFPELRRDSQVDSRLRELFSPSVALLGELLERDIPWDF